MPRVPQLVLTLSPENELVAELPGAMATRRKLELHGSPEVVIATIRRILEAQVQDQTEIGLDGAPTEAQVRHWERHESWASAQCKFCIAEGRISGDPGPKRTSRREVIYRLPSGVEVRKIKARVSGLQRTSESKKAAEDLGL